MHSPREEWMRFKGCGSVTIANTTEETSQMPSGEGHLNLEPENLQTNKAYRIRLRGHVSTSSTVDTTIRIKLGSTVILEHTGSLPSGLDEAATDFDAELRVIAGGALGSVSLNGMTRTASKHGVGTITGRSLSADSVAVDLSTTKTLDVTYQWGTAAPGNTLTITHATVEVWD